LCVRELSNEQQGLVRGLTHLGATASRWSAGRPVRPDFRVAAAARAAQKFGTEAGVPSMPVTRLRAAPDKPLAGRPAGLARGTGLIVDEAANASSSPGHRNDPKPRSSCIQGALRPFVGPCTP
jgi:hypothetical protein